MSLIDLVDNTRTDKNTVHSYLELYQDLLSSKKDSAKNVLEVGIFQGGSIKLWHDFFTNANVYGLDIISINKVWNEVKNKKRIYLYTSTDAYNEDIFNMLFLSKEIKFDFILDDGPHTIESMQKLIRLYSKVMADDGILIIEDVQSWDWIEILTNEVPEHLKKYVRTYDLRHVKGRYDDIVFTINKNITDI
jgi:cephalosporin hydroxylase